MSPQTGIAVASAIGAFVLAVLLYKAHKIWFLVCAVAFALSVVVLVHFQKTQAYEESGNDQEWAGLLKPGNDSSLTRPKTCHITGDEARLFLGDANIVATKTEMTVLEMTNGSLIKIRRDDPVAATLSLNLRLIDERGGQLVKIETNGFVINPHAALRMLISKDASHLRVYDFGNREILNLTFRNPSEMYLTGSFAQNNGFPFVVTQDQMMVKGSSASGVCNDSAEVLWWIN